MDLIDEIVEELENCIPRRWMTEKLKSLLDRYYAEILNSD